MRNPKLSMRIRSRLGAPIAKRVDDVIGLRVVARNPLAISMLDLSPSYMRTVFPNIICDAEHDVHDTPTLAAAMALKDQGATDEVDAFLAGHADRLMREIAAISILSNDDPSRIMEEAEMTSLLLGERKGTFLRRIHATLRKDTVFRILRSDNSARKGHGYSLRFPDNPCSLYIEAASITWINDLKLA